MKSAVRKLGRRLCVRWQRRLLGRMTTHLQAGCRRPNYLSIAMRCFKEVIRLHKKWIKDMPEYFDEQVIAQRKREKEDER